MNSATFKAFSEELIKIADVDQATDIDSNTSKEQVAPVHQVQREHPAWTAAKGIGGFALGAGAGFTGMHYADKAIKHLGGDGVPLSVLQYGAPIAGAATGLGMAYLQHRMLQQIRPPEVPVNGLDQSTGDGVP